MYMNYRSVSDLNNAILRNLAKFPHDVDLIVGIPRSGMLPANLLALYLNKPYADIDSFIEGRIYACGERGTLIVKEQTKKVIIIDDSIFCGGALKKAKEKLCQLKKDYSFIFCAVYAVESSTALVDVYCEIVNPPRIFQWNFFHHSGIIPNSCFDIDGVLCEDPPIDDDGPLYSQYIKHAIPKYLPSVEIDTLVTCRLEKYRKITEEWLKNNNVRYKKLIMLDMQSREERLAWGRHGQFKGAVYKDLPCILFVESSLKQAKEIVRMTNKPVFCTETFSMVENDSIESVFKKLLHVIHVFLWKVKCALFQLFR